LQQRLKQKEAVLENEIASVPSIAAPNKIAQVTPVIPLCFLLTSTQQVKSSFAPLQPILTADDEAMIEMEDTEDYDDYETMVTHYFCFRK
jgi:hypothetical protein